MSGRAVLLGVDVGTTRVKALALTVDGVVVGAAARPQQWLHEGTHAELDPAELADLVIATCVEAVADAGDGAARAGTVLGIGFTGMAETGALLDGAGRVLAPGLAWFDTRADLAAVGAVTDARTFCGTTGQTFTSQPSLGKVAWLIRNVPGAASAVRHLSVGEWVVRRLGGREVAERSLLSRTAMWDVLADRPWDAAAEVLGRRLVPDEVISAGDEAGTAGPEAPPVLRGAVLTVAGHDHQCAAFALGAARDGVLLDSLGTAEALVLDLPRVPSPDEPGARDLLAGAVGGGATVNRSVVPGHLCGLASLLTGLTLERVCAVVGATTRERRTALGTAALDVDAAANLVRVLAVDGDALTIGGITERASPAELFAAALAHEDAECARLLAVLEGIGGPRRATVAAGGWLNNPSVARARRRMHPQLSVSALPEAGATGAAIFAGIAAGVLPRPGPHEVPRWADGTPTHRGVAP